MIKCNPRAHIDDKVFIAQFIKIRKSSIKDQKG